jgi:ATP-binding cassette subfamily F protein 3
MLNIENLTYRIGSKTLFEGASARISSGQKVALVGKNGCGKSTLLRLIQGQIASEGGDIEISKSTRLGAVAQEAPDGPESLVETVLAADTERTELLRQSETEHDPDILGHVHERLLAIDAYRAPARAATILSGLGFDEAAQQRPCKAFSGGWRMRVALAAALASSPDLLVLDEPTNHLDLEACLWLEGFLKSYEGTILMVSHDRGFLNAIPDIVIHVDNRKLKSYRGNFDQFERQRTESMRHLTSQAARQDAQRKHMEAFVERFRAKASKARQAQSRLKALEKMTPIIVPLEDQPVSFTFPQPAELPPPLMTLENVSTGYQGKTILSGLNLRIDGDDRIALLGANGNGKSTFLKLLVGELQPTSGVINKSSKLKVGYFAQHQSELFNLQSSVLLEAKGWMKLLTEEKVRAHLGRFGFSGKSVDTKIGSLSGGEKARLLLALVTKDAPHILLLDEPTNHLDIDTREALMEALNDFEGAVILVTHDPHLIETTADRLWLVAGGKVEPFDGDLDDYAKYLANERRALKSGGEPKPGRAKIADEKPKSRKAGPLRKVIQQAESDMERLKKDVERLTRETAKPDFFRKQSSEIASIRRGLDEAQAALAKAEADWLEASSELEALADVRA